MPELNIYIVEDNLLVAAMLKRMITSLGYSVCGSSTSYERAVNDLVKIEADLVITDIMLNGTKTGIDLGRFIKEHLHIPFIFHSSITSAKMIEDALDTLPQAYLHKPASKNALAAAISEVLI